MTQPTRIHRDKSPQRYHAIAAWAEHRHLSQADIVRAIGVDKSQVSRWFKGAVPEQSNLEKLAALFEVEPYRLFQDPYDDWLAQKFRNRSAEERERILRLIEIAFPEKDGTNG